MSSAHTFRRCRTWTQHPIFKRNDPPSTSQACTPTAGSHAHVGKALIAPTRELAFVKYGNRRPVLHKGLGGAITSRAQGEKRTGYQLVHFRL